MSSLETTPKRELIGEIAKILLAQNYSGLWHWHGGLSPHFKYKGQPIKMTNGRLASQAYGVFSVPVTLDDNKGAGVSLEIRFSASNSKVIAAREQAAVAGEAQNATLVAHCLLKQFGHKQLEQPNKDRCGTIGYSVAYFDQSRSFGMKVSFGFLMQMHEFGFLKWSR